MNTMLKSFLILLYPIFVFSQIPNPSFENWTDSQPDGWFSYDFFFNTDAIIKSTDSHEGTYAARVEVPSYMDVLFPGVLYSFNEDNPYFPVSQNHGSVRGFLKFHKENAQDYVSATAFVFAADSISFAGAGSIEIDQEYSNYTEFEIPIEYIPGVDAALMYLTFIIDTYDTALTAGTYFILDDLSLGVVTGIGKESGITPNEFLLDQNFPNPFNPQTTIKYNLLENTFVNLVVYDNSGRLVKTLVDQNQSTGSYSIRFDGSGLSSGIYYYRIEAGTFAQVKRMLLIK